MDSFDLILIIMGALLIAVGLGLFVFGKTEGHKNYLEGFGIKMDVSNPSIILIVVGVGLLLAPRILPSDKPAMGEVASPLQTQVSETNGNRQKPSVQQPTEPRAQVSGAEQNTSRQPDSQYQPQQPRSFFPQGYWQLSDYQESGVTLGNVQGNIFFSQQAQDNSAWVADFNFMDMWGNVASYRYQGQIWVNAGQYYISLTNSNDPGFMVQPQTVLELIMEQGNRLHMQYHYKGTEILLHFTQ